METPNDLSKFKKKTFVVPHADLSIQPYYAGIGPMPQSGFCDLADSVSQIRFLVRNTGAKDVLNTRVHVNWGSYGTTTRGINPVGAGGAVHVRIPIPSGAPDTAIPFSATADHLQQVFEISEANNTSEGTCIKLPVPSPGGGS